MSVEPGSTGADAMDGSSMDTRLQEALKLLNQQKASQMLVNQEHLPRLPIPSLEDSAEDFLRACEPLLKEGEFAQTKAECEEFLKKDGPRLHKLLQEREDKGDTNSYLEEFWERAYLLQRSPICINTNPFFVLEDDPTPARTSQIARATSLVWSALKFCASVRSGELEPDMQRTTPLCMFQYTRLFGTTRIPQPQIDTVQFYPSSKHIVVMSRGNMYWLDVLSDDGKVAIAQSDLEQALRSIRGDSMSFYPSDNLEQAVGLLTTEDREVWAVWRRQLIESSSKNAENFKIVDSAIFLLCLDDTSPASQADTASNSLHGTSELSGLEGWGGAGVQCGTCMNRWYDKSLSIIVCQNGAAGINFEHSVIDGHSVLRFASDVFTDTILTFAENIRKGFQASKSTGPKSSGVGVGGGAAAGGGEGQGAAARVWERIVWDIDAETSNAIRKAEAKVSDMIPQVSLHALDFSGYGKNFIVSQKMSPDAYVQVAFQVAYHRLYRESVTTYETLMTKRFLHGRTEAGFCVTKESIELAESWEMSTQAENIANIRKAVDAHVKLVRVGGEGRGVRHFFALRCLAEQEEGGHVPRVLNGCGWGKLNSVLLSTSNCGNPALRMFGFGPVHKDGFGIGYIIKDDNMGFCATSNHRQTFRLMNALQVALLEMQSTLEATQAFPLRLSINTSDRSFERAGGQQPSSAHSGKVTGGGQIQSKGMRSPMFSSGGMLASPLARSTD